jgi:hypothetical protein
MSTCVRIPIPIDSDWDVSPPEMLVDVLNPMHKSMEKLAPSSYTMG